MRTLVAFLCFLPWLTLAQVPTMPGGAVPWYKKPTASSFTPKDIPSIAYRWVWTNVSGSPVQSWRDEIRGDYFVQGTSAARPTTNASGVYFEADKYLVCSNFTRVLANTNAFLLVFKLDGAAGGVYRSIFSDSSAANTIQVKNTGILCNDAVDTYSSAVPNDTVIDWVFDGGDQKNYTNNIISLSGKTYTTATYTEVGTSTAVGNAWTLKGWIAEFCVFTNILSSTSRSNLHWYATNTYSFTP